MEGELIKLTKRELKVLGITQGYGLVQISHFVQNVYDRKREDCEKSIRKLVALNLLREDGLVSVMPGNVNFDVVESNELWTTIKLAQPRATTTTTTYTNDM